MKTHKQSKNHILCPCTSKKWYEECCKPYHNGVEPESALLLMRSRYSAYALQLADYIIQTTHPDNRSYSVNFQNWKKEILQFCTHTRFERLKIVEFVDGVDNASVTFTAYLKQGVGQESHEATFTEKSDFVKVDRRWLYKSGEILCKEEGVAKIRRSI